MQATENVDVIIYRVKEKGLEVFLVNQKLLGDPEQWNSLQAGEHAHAKLHEANFIELDPVMDANGDIRQVIAIEADWQDIPSLRALMYEDYRVAKEKAKTKLLHFLPEMEKGAYFAVKEAVKKVMPEQYAFIKELKDILLEKNQTKYV